MRKLLLCLVVFIGSCTASGGSKYVTYDPNRTLFVKGLITNLSDAPELLLKMSETKKPITIVLNSGGGDVMGGMYLIRAIDRIKTRGITVRCIVLDSAASMAIHILDSCNVRYALPTSIILWHEFSYPDERVTESTAATSKQQLYLLSNFFMTRLQRNLQLDDKTFNEYLLNEFIILAYELNKISPNYLTIIDDVRVR